MRRSRWDHKSDSEEPLPSSSNWNELSARNLIHLNWNRENTNTLENVNSPHPLDYSKPSEERAGDNQTQNKKDRSGNRKDSSEQVPEQRPPLLPTPWPFVSDLHRVYPSGSSHDSQIPFQSHQLWNQTPQDYYPNSNPSGIFDMKWWDSVQAHLGLNPESTNKERSKYENGRAGHWAKGHKNSDRSPNLDFSRRFGRYQSLSNERHNKIYRDQRNCLPNNIVNARFNNNSKYDSTSQNRIWRHTGIRDFHGNMRQDFPQPYIWNHNNQGPFSSNGSTFDRRRAILSKSVNESNNSNKNKITSKNSSSKKGIYKIKKVKKKDSAAEKAKKKALAVAASKLKMTFLAAKRKPNKNSLNIHKGDKLKNLNEKNENYMKEKVQDLSVPKSIPRDSNLLEHDIDIKFSSREWESVGRGSGGMLDLRSLNQSKDDEENVRDHSDSESILSVEVESKESADNESENSDSCSDDDEGNVHWTTPEKFSPQETTRRRHVSESSNTKMLSSNNYPNLSKARRVRSYSTSQVEECSTFKSGGEISTFSIASNLKNILVKQLLTMDKKSLEELVNNPKSRKAQFMMSHFMTMHRVALSQKLNQLRFKNAPSTSNDDDLQMFNPSQLDNLPADVLQQVKEIIAFEETGKAQQMWEEVSLSLSDLFSELENTIQEEEKQQESSSSAEDNPNKNGMSENSDDCQIVTPPPKIPATTITIPDSDSEMQNENGPEYKIPIIKPSIIHSRKDLDQSNSVRRTILSDPFLKPPNLNNLRLSHFIRQSGLPPLTQTLPHFVSPTSLKDLPPRGSTSVSTGNPLSPCSPPSPSFSSLAKRLKMGMLKPKVGSGSLSLHQSREDPCQLVSSTVKVKQERPSPLMECGYCLHPPRSAHTPQCGFSFGIPPTALGLLTSSPRFLGPQPPRIATHLTPSGLPRVFKQEKPEVNYVSLDNVNRPSSEERPKNPAPPDTANSEPPSPLPIPPPQQTHQPPPRSLIFRTEGRFPEPPRPSSPPPPQHSPRVIKTERQTPQYICCCMRNECERGSGSRPSSDFRRPGTPLNQLCETANRLTPHMFRMDPSFYSGPRSKTPHSSILGIFPAQASPRCIASNNSVNNNFINVNVTSKVTVGVQTETAVLDGTRNVIPNISSASTPFSGKIDQMTSTDDLLNSPSPVVNNGQEIKNLRGFEEDAQRPESSIAINKEVPHSSERCITANQLLQMAKQEAEILQRLVNLSKKSQEIADEKLTLTKYLENINILRTERVSKLNWQSIRERYENEDDRCITGSEMSIDVQVPSNSSTKETEDNGQVSSENLYVVTSSQEDLPLIKRAESPTQSSCNDSEVHDSEQIQGQRCTSTSLTMNENDTKTSLDSENEVSLEYENKVEQLIETSCFTTQGGESSFYEEETEKNDGEFIEGNLEAGGEVSINEEVVRPSLKGKEEEYSMLMNNLTMNCGEDLDEPSNQTSLFSLPQSPKMRNSSGSEHGYSLRSRGPPSDLFEFNIDTQLAKDSTHEETEDKRCSSSEKNKSDENSGEDSNEEYQTENGKRRKRMRKNKVQIHKYKKKNVNISDGVPKNRKQIPKIDDKDVYFDPDLIKLPPPHLDAVLDLKVVGNFIFTASSDGTARLYDPKSGFVLATYRNHSESVTAVLVVGQPDFRHVAPDFQVITGSEDRFIHVYNGKTGHLAKSRNAAEPVRCLAHRWGYLFVGTDGGCGIKWNLKDKKLGEKIQFCGKGITQLIAHMEGGRKVLVVGAKTTPIMVRDAMSGLFLRTLEYMQLTVYSAVFEGNILYTGGADKCIYSYDYCAGSLKKTINVGTSISSLILVANHLVATCYDGFIRIFRLPEGQLVHCIATESSHRMSICSALYKNKILLGNKHGEIAVCDLPKL